MESSPTSPKDKNKPDDVEKCQKPVSKEGTPLPASPPQKQLEKPQKDTSPERTYEGKNSRASLEAAVNPPVPTELGEAECAMLRGDAIGTTAYTHRWVLNTLVTITQALPQYLNTDEKPAVDEEKMCPKKEAGGSQSSDAQVKPVRGTSSRGEVVELGEEVENAACQLWDMSAEPDVVEFLIKLEAVDVLQLANDIITLSKAPRLTEVIVGVVANLCCQGEGCEQVMGCGSLLPSCLALLHSTDDVPTLVEAFRLLRLLLWHATYRIPMEERSRCPLIMSLKSNEALKEALVFMLKNSLSDNLLSSLLEFLESLMYLWLPTEQCYMAAQYSESGLVEGVVEVMRHFLKASEKSGTGGEQPSAVHRGLLILYSFVSTQAVQIISSYDQYEPLLEPILVSYIEHMAKVEDVSELTEGDSYEQLVYALGLCELLVPTMRNTAILLPVGKLLALTHGATHHYTPGRSQSIEEIIIQEKILHEKSERRRRRSSRKRISRSTSSSQEEMETDNQDTDVQAAAQKGNKEDIVGAESTCHSGRKKSKDSWSGDEQESGVSTAKREGDFENDADSNSSKPDNAKETKRKIKSMIESLVDYCVRVVRCCPDLCSVFTTLNECHVHEVQLFFKAVKSREPTLVGQLQEQLLDTGSHNRLVTILSDMYT